MVQVSGISLKAGLERINPASFFKQICNWKESDVRPSNFKDFPPKETLPFQSVVHLLDNFIHLEEGEALSDIPSFDHPFLRNETSRKLLYHQVVPLTSGWIQTPNDYIFKNLQLQRNLDNWRMTQAGKYVIKRSLDDCNVKDTSLVIVNHNPIFRLFCRGTMLNWRCVEHFFASCFNTIQNLPDKMHYFVIPLAPKIFVKSKYTALMQRVASGSIQDKTSYQYAFLGQLYCFLNVNCKHKTIFDQIPENVWKKTCLVFTYSGHYLFWTLESLKNLNQRNQIYDRFFNHINGFILQGILEENARNNELETLDPEDTTTESIASVEATIANTYSQITKTPLEKVAPLPSKSSDEDYQDEEDSKELDMIAREVSAINFTLGNTTTSLDLSDVDALAQKEIKTPEEDKSQSSTIEVVDVGGDQDLALTELYQDARPYYSDSELTSDPPLPGSRLHVFSTPEEVSKVGADYISKIDEEAKLHIVRNTQLTDAQKQRALKMAESYKTVMYDGKPLEAYLTAKIDPTLKDISTITVLDKEHTPDPSFLTSSVVKLDYTYMQRFYIRHMLACAASVASQGMYLQAVEKKVTDNELTQSTEFTLRYKTVAGKSHTVRFSVPIVRPDGTFLVNGVRSNMNKQFAVRPISKVSPTRVSLASNYNKTLVEKKVTQAHDFLVHISSYINQIQEEAPNCIQEVRFGSYTPEPKDLCGYEFWKMAQKYRSLLIRHQSDEKQVSILYFGSPKERKHDKCFTKDVRLSDHDWARIEDFEEKHKANFVGIRYGTGMYAPAAYYLDLNSVLHMVGKDFHIKTSLFDLLDGTSKIPQKKTLTEWTDVKILDAKFPVGFLLCYRFGLQNVLRRLNVKYRKFSTRARANDDTNRPPSPSEIMIRFAHGEAIIIPRYPLKVSFIMQGLAMFKTQQALIEDFEHKDIYYQLLLDKKMGAGRTNYLIGIDDTFDMFVDMMTYERLKQMGEPTTFDGLLVRATEMLTYPWHEDSSSMANHALRSYERFNSIFYRELTGAMRMYKRQRGPSATFSMNPNAVLQSILQDPSVALVEDINPIHDMQNTTKATYLGMGGRTAESFTQFDRRFTKDMTGIVSEMALSNSKVGISAQTTMDPTINNMYGLMESSKKFEDLGAGQLLSAGACHMATTMNDDPPRMSFVSIQLAHWMPTKESDVLRIRTGFEAVAAHRVTDLYAISAKDDGKVIEQDDKLKLIKVRYKSGEIETFSYDTQYGVCSDIVSEQKQVVTVKKGDTFKKQDILRYNPQFFKPEIDHPRQVNLTHGITARVAFVENTYTFEDSNAITEDLSRRLEIHPVVPRILILPRTASIHEYKVLGDEVEILTPLVVFEREDYTDLSGITTDAESLAFLEKMNQTSPKAKTKGTIVDIKVLYACDLSDLSSSMREMIEKYTKRKAAIKKYVSDSSNRYEFAGASQVPENAKYKGTTIDLDTVVIEYLIQERFNNATGDKIVVDSSLKTVTCATLSEAPTTERGQVVDCIFSAASSYNRIINSPVFVGLAETILEELEKKIVDIYTGDTKKATESLLRSLPNVEKDDISLVQAKKEVISKEEWDTIREIALSLWSPSQYSQDRILDGSTFLGYQLVQTENDTKKELVALVRVHNLQNDKGSTDSASVPTSSNTCARIELFAIHPQRHGRHLGTRFFHLTLGLLRLEGYEWATLAVRNKNTPAKRIYYGSGFKQYLASIELKRSGSKVASELPEGYTLRYVKDLDRVLLNKIDAFIKRHDFTDPDLEKFTSSAPQTGTFSWMGSQLENRVAVFKQDVTGGIVSFLTMKETDEEEDGYFAWLYTLAAESATLVKELIQVVLSYKGIQHCSRVLAIIYLKQKYYKEIVSLGTLYSENAYIKLSTVKPVTESKAPKKKE